MKRILVVNVNWLGDVIFSTPVFKALRKEYPQARIVCLAVPRVKEILECCSDIDEIIEYDEKGKHKGLFKRIQLIQNIKEKNFDIAFLLHRSWTRALLIYLSGIPQRVGYDTKKRGRFLTHKVPQLTGKVHRSDFYLNVLESFGIVIKDRFCELKVPDQTFREIDKILRSSGLKPQDQLVVVNAGGNWNLKRWPEELWGKLIHHLGEDRNIKIVIPGASKDVFLANKIAELSARQPIVLAGKTTIKQLIALMARAHLVISADSGPLHMANCVGANTIALFGPTRPEITGPRGKGQTWILQKNIDCNLTPCYFLECPNNVCMQAIKVQDVMQAVSRFNKKEQDG